MLAAVLAAVLAGCSSGVDKAGGHRKASPLVLTLEQPDPWYSGARFAAAVAKRSGGSIRIDVSPQWHHENVDYEAGVVRAVRAHRADLGVVGARVWDTLGVTSLQALIAPFLVDNLALERRVLESPLAPRMLGGVERGGVKGIALLPGPVRMPFGLTRPLVHRADYEEFRMGAYPGRVEALTQRALGARVRHYLSLRGASREGAILNYNGIGSGVGYHGKTLVTNVVFWTRPETVVMNRGAFEALTPAQRKILVDAGRDAIGTRLAEVERLEKNALASICERKLAALVTAPAADVAALNAAVQPVYAQLERNAGTRELIARIRALRTGGPTGNDEPRNCPAAGGPDASQLEGSWKSSVPRKALLERGASAAEAATYEGSGTLDMKGGQWVFHGEHTTVTGTYVVEGDLIRLTMRTCTANPCSRGAVTEYTWSVYRDTLALTGKTGELWPRLVATAARRVR